MAQTASTKLERRRPSQRLSGRKAASTAAGGSNIVQIRQNRVAGSTILTDRVHNGGNYVAVDRVGAGR